MQCLKKACPEAHCLYLADSVHFPYGTKSAEEVTECASSAVSLILKKWNPDAVVIACNTISVTSLTELRRRFPQTPIVGTVPAIKLAAKVSVNRRIGLLATEGTVHHPYTLDLEKKYAADCKIISRGDTALVAFIEHDFFNAGPEERKKAVQPAVAYFAANNCDTIVLACTHFIHVASVIAQEAGPAVKVVDSRDGVTRQALKVVEDSGKRENSIFNAVSDFLRDNAADESLFVTGFKDPDDFSEYRLLCSRLSIPWGGIVELSV